MPTDSKVAYQNRFRRLVRILKASTKKIFLNIFLLEDLSLASGLTTTLFAPTQNNALNKELTWSSMTSSTICSSLVRN